MEEERIQSYLRQQIRLMLQAGSRRPGTLSACFTGTEPRDNEILGLLALSTMRPEFPLRHRFATPLEVVARLPGEVRAKLCQEFRKRARGSGVPTVNSFCDRPWARSQAKSPRTGKHCPWLPPSNARPTGVPGVSFTVANPGEPGLSL